MKGSMRQRAALTPRLRSIAQRASPITLLAPQSRPKCRPLTIALARGVTTTRLRPLVEASGGPTSVVVHRSDRLIS